MNGHPSLFLPVSLGARNTATPRVQPAAAVIILAVIGLLSAARPAAATPPVFAVNSVFDVPADFTNDPGFDICRTNVANSVCTLRAAIMNANRYPGAGATINIPSGTYTLTIAPDLKDDDSVGDLNIDSDMTIIGASAANTTIDGNQMDRVFNVKDGATVTISQVMIYNGRVNNTGGGVQSYGKLLVNACVISGNATMGGSSGGGVANLGKGTMTLTNTAVLNNTADGNAGGIYNDNNSTLVVNGGIVSGNQTLNGGYGGGLSNSGVMTLDHCPVSNNQASGKGGGIANFNGTLTVTNSIISANSTLTDGGAMMNWGTATVTDSTLSANGASGNGGAIFSIGTVTLTDSTLSANGAHGNGGAIYQNGVLYLFHVTVAGNVADRDAANAGAGGGMFQPIGGGSNQIWNSLFAENYAAGAPNDCRGDALTSEDYNYIQTSNTARSCAIAGTTTHNVTGGDAWLDALQDNGGFTSTRALLAGSPAIDRIPPALCRDAFGDAPFPDQRGVPRPVGPLCDIGAYEGQQPAVGYQRNLVRNGDAEAAAGSPSGAFVGVPNWRAGGPQALMTSVPYGAPGGFPSPATDSLPPVTGVNFFAGGNSGVAVSIQDIDLSPLAADIDAGVVNYDCSADLGGYADQEDNATVEYDLLDQSSHLLSQVILGPVTAADRGNLTGLLHRGTGNSLPMQTRTVEVFVTLTRASGTSNDGYADNISLVLTSTLPTPTPSPSRTATLGPTSSPTPTVVPVMCAGDCDGGSAVTVNEIITLVNIALGQAQPVACPSGIPAGRTVDITLIIQAVGYALTQCPAA